MATDVVTLSKFLSNIMNTEVEIRQLPTRAGYQLYDAGKDLEIGQVSYADIVKLARPYESRTSDWEPVVRVLQQYQDSVDIWEGIKKVVWA